MSNEHGQPASMVPSTRPPPKKKYSAALKQKARNTKSSISAPEPSKSAPSSETDGAVFSPWTWDFPGARASSSSGETKTRIVIEEGSYFHNDLHALAEFGNILTRLKEKLIGKDLGKLLGTYSEKN